MSCTIDERRDPLLNVGEVAEMLSVEPSWLYGKLTPARKSRLAPSKNIKPTGVPYNV